MSVATSSYGLRPNPGANTPGSLGTNDRAVPNSSGLLAVTAGPVGVNDSCDPRKTCQVGLQVGWVVMDTRPFPSDEYFVKLASKDFEGSVAWLYLDTSGFVTIGNGHNLEAGGSSAVAPPAVFQVKFLDNPTTDQIEQAWLAIKKRPSGKHHPWTEFEDVTSLRIDPAEMRRLAGIDVANALRYLKLSYLFPNVDEYPVPAREALLDMVFNMGPGKKGGCKGLAQPQYADLRAAVLYRDWLTAAQECYRGGVLKARNDWTKAQFLAAADWDRFGNSLDSSECVSKL